MAVNRMDVTAQLLCGQTAVAIAAGKGAAQTEMNHFIALFYPGTEIADIFIYVNGAGTRQHPPFSPGPIQVFRHNVHTVLIIFAVQLNVIGNGVQMQLFTQFLRQITSAVGA